MENKEKIKVKKAVKSLSFYMTKEEIKKGIIAFFSSFSPYMVNLGIGITYDFMDTKFNSSFRGLALGWNYFFNGMDIKDVYNELANTYYHAEAYYSGVLLKNESSILGKRWTYIFELTISPKTIADFAIFPSQKGKSSIGIEIKTDLDSLKRLDHQLTDYYKVFDIVWVLTTESKAKKVHEIIERNATDNPTCNHQKAGILILDGTKINISEPWYCDRGGWDVEKNNDDHWNVLFNLLAKPQLKRIVPKEIDSRKWTYRELCLDWIKNNMSIGEFREKAYREIASKYKHQSDLAISQAKDGYFIFCQPAFQSGYCNFDERSKKPLEGKEPSLNG